MLDLLLYSFISLPLSVTHCSSFSSSTSTSCCCRFSSSSTAAGSIYSQGPGSGILTPAGDSVKSRSFCCSCWRRWCPSADCACQANYDGGRIMFLRLPLPLRRLIGCTPANSHWIWKFRDFDFFFFLMLVHFLSSPVLFGSAAAFTHSCYARSRHASLCALNSGELLLDLGLPRFPRV